MASIHADSGERKNKIPVVSASLRASAAAGRTLIVVARSPRQDHLIVISFEDPDHPRSICRSYAVRRRKRWPPSPPPAVRRSRAKRRADKPRRLADCVPHPGRWRAQSLGRADRRVGEARPVTTVTDRNLGPWIVWMRDNRHVVFFRETAGDENWRAWRVDLETGDVRPLTPRPGVTCYIQQHSRHFPSELLIAHNARGTSVTSTFTVSTLRLGKARWCS